MAGSEGAEGSATPGSAEPSENEKPEGVADAGASVDPEAAEASHAAGVTGPGEISAVPGEADPSTEPELPAIPVMASEADEADGTDGTDETDGAESPRGSVPHRVRMAFRHWRRTRPFWGGFLATLGGAEILFTYKAPLKLVLHFGLYGLAGFALPGLLTVCGLLLLFDPQHRTFYSVLTVLAACGTWLTSNLGGFLIGMLLGVVGGSLAFGWVAGAEPRKPKKHRIRRLLRRAAT